MSDKIGIQTRHTVRFHFILSALVLSLQQLSAPAQAQEAYTYDNFKNVPPGSLVGKPKVQAKAAAKPAAKVPSHGATKAQRTPTAPATKPTVTPQLGQSQFIPVDDQMNNWRSDNGQADNNMQSGQNFGGQFQPTQTQMPNQAQSQWQQPQDFAQQASPQVGQSQWQQTQEAPIQSGSISQSQWITPQDSTAQQNNQSQSQWQSPQGSGSQGTPQVGQSQWQTQPGNQSSGTSQSQWQMPGQSQTQNQANTSGMPAGGFQPVDTSGAPAGGFQPVSTTPGMSGIMSTLSNIMPNRGGAQGAPAVGGFAVPRRPMSTPPIVRAVTNQTARTVNRAVNMSVNRMLYKGLNSLRF